MRLLVQTVVLLPGLSLCVGWDEVTGHDIAWSKSSLSLLPHCCLFTCVQMCHVMIKNECLHCTVMKVVGKMFALYG
jgi:hypothetical protein